MAHLRNACQYRGEMREKKGEKRCVDVRSLFQEGKTGRARRALARKSRLDLSPNSTHVEQSWQERKGISVGCRWNPERELGKRARAEGEKSHARSGTEELLELLRGGSGIFSRKKENESLSERKR